MRSGHRRMRQEMSFDHPGLTEILISDRIYDSPLTLCKFKYQVERASFKSIKVDGSQPFEFTVSGSET